VRLLGLKPAFFHTRRVHAPPGTVGDKGVRSVLRSLADDRIPLPGPSDEMAFRAPFLKIWARPVPGTNLVVTYMITADAVEVTAVRPAWSEHR
jgi:hypothetical protein